MKHTRFRYIFSSKYTSFSESFIEIYIPYFSNFSSKLASFSKIYNEIYQFQAYFSSTYARFRNFSSKYTRFRISENLAVLAYFDEKYTRTQWMSLQNQLQNILPLGRIISPDFGKFLSSRNLFILMICFRKVPMDLEKWSDHGVELQVLIFGHFSQCKRAIK